MAPQRALAQRLHWESATARHLLYAALMLAGVIAFGMAGYTVSIDCDPIEALYLTAITMSTVGFGIPQELGSGGKLFVVVLIIGSVGTVGYSLTTIVSFMLEGQFRLMLKGRRMDRRINNLRDHIILCGCGNTGRWIAEEFFKTGTSFVVVELDASSLEEVEVGDDLLAVLGDATDDETLTAAGIERARGLVTVLSEDKDNVYVALSARALNPHLRIISRVVDEDNAGKLMKAGVDQVVSPNRIGGERIASAMVRPAVVGFLDRMLSDPDSLLRMEDVLIAENSGMVGKTLAEIDIGRKTGAMIIAVRGVGNEFVFNPHGDTSIDSNSVLVVLGTPDQIHKVEILATDESLTRRLLAKNG